MGETSKKRGEFGENVVENLIKSIGWSNFIKGIDIGCISPIEHAVYSQSRTTHGLDFLYQYDSPLFTNTKDFVLISSKYNDEYPANPYYRFRSHLKDIVNTIECFKKSPLKNKLSELGKTNCYYGVIFWLDNGKDSDFDLIEQLSDFKVEDELDFDAVFLVDNKRASFLHQTLSYTQNRFSNGDIEFLIPNIGFNSTVRTRKSSSTVLPVQFINSSIIPLKVIQQDIGKESLVLSVIDEFNEEHLIQLISLAQKLTEGWSNQVSILFPHFNENTFGSIVEGVKLEFLDQSFVAKVHVGTFDPDFRSFKEL